MFKVTMSPTFWAPVKAEVQGEDGGRVPIAFDVQYKRLTVPQIEEVAKRCLDNMTDVREGNEQFVREVAVGWRHVVGDDGEIPFGDQAMSQVFALGMALPMVDAFYKALPKARAKN